jgi:hypothetical protein
LMSVNAGCDYNSKCYWFSVGCSLLRSLQQDKSTGFECDIFEFGILTPEDLGFDSMDDVTETSSEHLEGALQLFIFRVYQSLVTRICEELHPILEDAFVTSAHLILDFQVESALPEGLVRRPTIYTVAEKLVSLLAGMISNYCFPSIIQQCFHQVIYYISVSLFNLLITKPGYCTPKISLQIKMTTMFLQNWLNEQNLKYDKILGTAV